MKRKEVDLIIYIPEKHLQKLLEVTPPGQTPGFGGWKGKDTSFPQWGCTRGERSSGDVSRNPNMLGLVLRQRQPGWWRGPSAAPVPGAQVFAPQDTGAGCTAQTLPWDSLPQQGEGQGSHHRSPCPFGCCSVTLARKNLFLGLIKILLKHIFSSSKHTRFQWIPSIFHKCS